MVVTFVFDVSKRGPSKTVDFDSNFFDVFKVVGINDKLSAGRGNFVEFACLGVRDVVSKVTTRVDSSFELKLSSLSVIFQKNHKLETQT